MKARAETIQDRNAALLVARRGRAGRPLRRGQGGEGGRGRQTSRWPRRCELQRQAQFRADFVNAENSMGFHAPQEAARILAEAIDYARQGEIEALRVAQARARR